jgi:hypothetical protein
VSTRKQESRVEGKLLSSKEIEEQIEKYPLKFLQVRDERVEWGIPFPMFVTTFRCLMERNDRIPSQDEFVENYFADNASELAATLTTAQLKTGLEARLRRTYPSLVRDAHFEALLRERGLDVVYDPKADIQAGIDHTVTYKGVQFHLHCYVKTKAGRYGRKIKNRRHDFQGIHLDVEMDLGAEDSKKVGDFALYSGKHVDIVMEQMESKLKNSLRSNKKSHSNSGKN